MNGIDVSNWQPKNIGQIVEYDFLISKATEGMTYKQPYFAQQVADAIARGKLYGSYHYASPSTPVTGQADEYLKTISAHIGKSLMVLDIETHSISNPATFTDSFLARVKSKTGIAPAVYSYTSYLSQYGLAAIAKKHGAPLWIANYGKNAATGYRNPGTPPIECAMWQYGSCGYLDGYAGRLDVNWYYGDTSDWQAMCKGEGATPDDTESAKPIVKTIKRGSKGANVVIWQCILMAEGYSLPKYGADGSFGAETAAATVLWQADHGLAKDAIVGPLTWASAGYICK